MSSNTITKPFKNQVWEQLKPKYNRNNLFEDPIFPLVSPSSLRSKYIHPNSQWKRPTQVHKDPQFVINGFDKCDLDQGYLGDCWFLAACVGILQAPKCFAKVVPTDQDYGDDYAGIFHFRFWHYGEWVDVVIDDRLLYDPSGQLVTCSNKDQPNEMWGPLLEKAYAKLIGGYTNLYAGSASDALIDMSGGIQESFMLKELKPDEKANFWKIMYQSYNLNSILGCSIKNSTIDINSDEATLSNGLVVQHAYTITKMAQIMVNGNTIRLIRIRNPWGNEVEYRGPWSDYSKEWNTVSQQQKDELGMVKRADGEFWMSYEDFMAIWDQVQICHLTVDSFSSELFQSDNDDDLTWECTSYHGTWIKGSTAGGNGSTNKEIYWTNPQYLINLKDVDKDDNENKATVIISLMQKYNREKSKTDDYIHFRLYKVLDDPDTKKNKTNNQRFTSYQLDLIKPYLPYLNCREVLYRYRVSPGNYVIIPSMYEIGQEGEFLLRIFTEVQLHSNELDKHANQPNKVPEKEKVLEIQKDSYKPKGSVIIGPASARIKESKPSNKPGLVEKPNSSTKQPKVATNQNKPKSNNENKNTITQDVEVEDACKVQ